MIGKTQKLQKGNLVHVCPEEVNFYQERKKQHASWLRYARNGACVPFCDAIVLDAALRDPKNFHCTDSKKINGARRVGV